MGEVMHADDLKAAEELQVRLECRYLDEIQFLMKQKTKTWQRPGRRKFLNTLKRVTTDELMKEYLNTWLDTEWFHKADGIAYADTLAPRT